MVRLMSDSIRILGIDPGLRITGFGVVDKAGSRLAYVASGCIRTDERRALPERIKTIVEGIAEVVASHGPAEAAVEKVFVNVNPQSTLLLGQARGAAIAGLVERALIVCADHELNSSTFAARVVISTQSDMSAAITGAEARSGKAASEIRASLWRRMRRAILESRDDHFIHSGSSHPGYMTQQRGIRWCTASGHQWPQRHIEKQLTVK